MMEEFIAFESVIYKAEVPKATDDGTEYNFLKTLDKAIVITYLQFPSKKIISSSDAFNAYRDFFV